MFFVRDPLFFCLELSAKGTKKKYGGYTFVVIEHDMEFIGRLCDPVICMAEGKVLAQGTLAEIKANEHVIEAYLGTGLKNKDKLADA